MTINTVEENSTRLNLKDKQTVWLFGYGSLIFKVDFPYIDKQPAYIKGWQRRFWQGSHDHRGTPTAPGRVVTLAPVAGATCLGMAYKVSTDVFEHLDFREKNGYLRFNTALYLDHQSARSNISDTDQAPAIEETVVYIATEDNAAFLGEASEQQIAEHIVASRGPSGENSEYLMSLAQALRELGAEDPHVFAIERHLKPLLKQ